MREIAPDIAVVLRDRVMPVLKSHGGGVYVRSFEDGVLHVGWVGACVGCPLRPFTVAAVLEPALCGVDGVERVEAEGSRLSAAASARLRAMAPVSASRSDLEGEQ